MKTFQELAAYYLEKTGVDVIAVTGSNGKTTTKDMIHDILATTYRTYKTQGNYNNEIGLPYTALHMPDDTEKIVLEMGARPYGRYSSLVKLGESQNSRCYLNWRLIWNSSVAVTRLPKVKCKCKTVCLMVVSCLCHDPIVDPFLPSNLEVVRFGDGAELTVSELTEYKDHLTFSTKFLDGQVTLPVTGKYNATNAMVAAYVAKHLGVTEENILSALANLQLTKTVPNGKKLANGADILSDVYNANPTAMKLVLETFSAIPKNEGRQENRCPS